jgi:hypothetical protein
MAGGGVAVAEDRQGASGVLVVHMAFVRPGGRDGGRGVSETMGNWINQERREARDLLDESVWYFSFLGSRRGPHDRPGEAFRRLSPEKRAALASLKSDDIANLRADYVAIFIDENQARPYQRLVEVEVRRAAKGK